MDSNKYKRINISVSRSNEEDHKWLMEYAKRERLSFSAAIFKLARKEMGGESANTQKIGVQDEEGK